MKTAVIGGGIAGLVAANELVKAGYRPILIEPAQIGGMIRSSSVDGFILEQGPNVLVERPDMKNLLLELGLHDLVRYPVVNPYGQFVWFMATPTACPIPSIALTEMAATAKIPPPSPNPNLH